MNILIIAHYGQQPPYNTMLRYHNWGKELVNRGHKVTVISASAVHNTDIDVIKELDSREATLDGVYYNYIYTPQYTGNGLGRIKNMYMFCRGIKHYKRLNPDIVIICGAYLFDYAKRIFKTQPIITDIVDLWPESIVEYAQIPRSHPAIKYLYYLEKKAYLNSDALIFSMEGGKDYIREQKYAAKIDYSRVFHINMGCDIIKKDEELKNVYFDLGWNPDDFNIVYCGSIRQANQVQQICDAAELIKNKGYKEVKFQIYGNGDDLAMLEQYVIEHSIDNVFFYGRIEKEKIPFILSNCKASIITYKQVGLMKYGGSQSKLFDYLASGRPIISNAQWGYDLIERYNCGVVASDQSAEALANAIEKLYCTNKAELSEMGKRARQVAEMYDQPQLVDKLLDVIEYVKQ